jgi:hypothetical protein
MFCAADHVAGKDGNFLAPPLLPFMRKKEDEGELSLKLSKWMKSRIGVTPPKKDDHSPSTHNGIDPT